MHHVYTTGVNKLFYRCGLFGGISNAGKYKQVYGYELPSFLHLAGTVPDQGEIILRAEIGIIGGFPCGIHADAHAVQAGIGKFGNLIGHAGIGIEVDGSLARLLAYQLNGIPDDRAYHEGFSLTALTETHDRFVYGPDVLQCNLGNLSGLRDKGYPLLR